MRVNIKSIWNFSKRWYVIINCFSKNVKFSAKMILIPKHRWSIVYLLWKRKYWSTGNTKIGIKLDDLLKKWRVLWMKDTYEMKCFDIDKDLSEYQNILSSSVWSLCLFNPETSSLFWLESSTVISIFIVYLYLIKIPGI